MKFEHKPYKHSTGEHGSLLYFRTRGPLAVLGYHVDRYWHPMLEVTIYPFKDKSIGKAWDLDIGPIGAHLRIGPGMCEILTGIRQRKLY